MREERALDVIRTRLAALAGVARVEIDPPDDHADQGPYPAIAVLSGDTDADDSEQQVQLKVRMPVTIRVVTQAAPETGNHSLPLNPRTAGYALLEQILPALWPGVTTGTYLQKLDNTVHSFRYTGHGIYPNDDGGKTSAVYVDAEMVYVLHLDNPDQ